MFQGILEFPQEFPGLRETFASVVRLEVFCATPEFVITISFFFFQCSFTYATVHIMHLLPGNILPLVSGVCFATFKGRGGCNSLFLST